MANINYFKNIINALIGAIEFVVSIIDKYKTTILITATAIGTYTLAIRAATLAMAAKSALMGSMISLTQVWTAAQRILNMVLSMNPLGWIVIAIAAISAVIDATIGWDKAWQYVKATIFGVWAAIKEIFSSVVTGLQSIGQGIKKIFEGDIKGGFASLSEGLRKIYTPDVITAFRNEYNKTLDEATAKTKKLTTAAKESSEAIATMSGGGGGGKLQRSAQFAKNVYFQTWLNDFFPKKSRRNIDLSTVEPAFQPIMADWLAYKSERGQTYRPLGLQRCYVRLLTLSGNDAAKARRIVDFSIANNYSGLFPPHDQDNSANRHPATDYHAQPGQTYEDF